MNTIYNTFGTEATCRSYIDYKSETELLDALATIAEGERILHVGGGSNLLFVNPYFDGVVLHNSIKTIEIIDETDTHVDVRVGGGVVWDDFVDWAVTCGYGGVENLSLIPGECGASAVQNIGAYGVEAKDVIVLVECIALSDGQKRILGNAECNYGYRQSIFKHELKGKYAVTYVTYRLSKTPLLNLQYGGLSKMLADVEQPTIADVRRAVIDVRRSKLPDPSVEGNAGSFFMNPVVPREVFEAIRKDYPDMPFYDAQDGVKIPAGWMIDQCGLKGMTLSFGDGDKRRSVGVHANQALVLVNRGGALASDVVKLSDYVCHTVFRQFGVEIHPEVNFIE